MAFPHTGFFFCYMHQRNFFVRPWPQLRTPETSDAHVKVPRIAPSDGRTERAGWLKINVTEILQLVDSRTVRGQRRKTVTQSVSQSESVGSIHTAWSLLTLLPYIAFTVIPLPDAKSVESLAKRNATRAVSSWTWPSIFAQKERPLPRGETPVCISCPLMTFFY